MRHSRKVVWDSDVVRCIFCRPINVVTFFYCGNMQSNFS